MCIADRSFFFGVLTICYALLQSCSPHVFCMSGRHDCRVLPASWQDVLGPSHWRRMRYLACCRAAFVPGPQLLDTHRTVTSMVPAIWALVSSPFFFSCTIHCTWFFFNFMPFGCSRLTYLRSFCRQTHTPVLPVWVRLAHLLLTDLAHSEKGRTTFWIIEYSTRWVLQDKISKM